jgi:eukaryotic-like serine/threonine-protein kinase
MPDSPAERLIANRYALQTPIGQGGMGVVWWARDTLLGRDVAVKEVRVPPSVPDLDREALRARVLREARAAARLNHPGAVTLYDVLNEQGHAFIVMELIHAPTLAQVVDAEGPLDPGSAARIGLQVASVLAAAHQAGIVHRDVKPANVMVAHDGTARLTDFGIARVQGDPKLTSTGLIVGSPAYMAPEQASGDAAGPAADLWGLGATLYFAVEGRPPFERAGSIATLAAAVNDETPSPRRAGAVGPIIGALLSKSPADRPTAGELRQRLQRVIAAEGEPTAVRPPGAPPARPSTGAPPRGSPDPSGRPGPSGPGHASPGRSRPDQPARPVPPVTATLPGHPAVDLAEASAAPADLQERTGAPRRPRRPAGAPLFLSGGRLAAVALLVVAALVGAGLGLSRVLSRGEDGRAGGAPGATHATTSQSGAAPATTAPPGGEPGQRVPPGWVGFRRQAGAYSLAYPRGWRLQTFSLNNDTDLRGPGGLLLRVQSSDRPGDPMQVWTRLERAFARSHARQGYQRIAFGRGSYGGLDAVVWEFSYDQGGQRVRARDVTFKSATGRWAYAVLFQSPERRWAEAQGTAAQLERAFTALG